MKRTCPMTGEEFEISNADLEFYERISPQIAGKKYPIPPPTLSPDARLMRRMTWRNDRTFFRRNCDKTGESIVAIYPEETPFPVYHPTAWWADDWSSEDYGREVSFDRPFFEQWHELMNDVPRLGVDIVNCENSDYCNYCGDDRNCYLDIAGEANEDCYYNLFTKYSKNCVDCTFVYRSELAHQSINCYSCHSISFGYYLENCHDCHFCFDLKGCNNCLFSSNLRQKEYHIFNQPYSKEEYQQKLEELRLDSFASQQENIAKWKEMMQGAIHRDMYNLNSENCTGDNIQSSKNCHVCYNITDCWDCKFLYDVLDAKDCYDLNYSLYHPEASYELISTLSMKYSAFNMASHYCGNTFYSDQCNNSSFLFGCIAMNQKKYCILNKQYSQAEYEQLVPKIIEHMRDTGEWGEFFPSRLSPWGYNETVAQEYFPLEAEDAKAIGVSWREKAESSATGEIAELPNLVSETNDALLQATLICSVTGKPFRLIKQELDFYRKMNYAVPRECPDSRHLTRLHMRNPRTLYNRTCDATGRDIVSTYAPNRPEKVYCDDAYVSAVR